MTKDDAITMFGGTVTSTAHALGITVAAVVQWPDGELPPKIRDRIQAYQWREYQTWLDYVKNKPTSKPSKVGKAGKDAEDEPAQAMA